MMRKWLNWLHALKPAQPELTAEEATEKALRVFPKCC